MVQHNHYREGSLAIERMWVTKSWYLRMLDSYLGIIVTSTYFAYRYEMNTNPYCISKHMNYYGEMVEKLSDMLISNRFLDDTVSLRNINEVQDTHPESHSLKQLRLLRMYRRGVENGNYPQRRCVKCGNKCSWYCRECSTAMKQLVCYCGIGVSRNCFYSNHVINFESK